MSHYSNDADSVRVDFFTVMGKWKYTEAVKWTGEYTGDIFEAFRVSLRAHLGFTKPRFSGLRAVCLEPHHEHSHPITLVVDWGQTDGPPAEEPAPSRR